MAVISITDETDATDRRHAEAFRSMESEIHEAADAL